MEAPVPAVILKSTPFPFHPGTMGIIRRLGRLGVPVYAVRDSRWEPDAFSRFLRGQFIEDLGELTDGAAVDYLLGVSRRLGRPALLLPVDDVAAIFVAGQGGALRERFLFPEPPDGLVRSLASKKELYLLCRRLGIPTPETMFPGSRGDVLRFLERATFPVVLKSDDPVVRRRTNAQSVVIAETARQLLTSYDRMERPDRPNLMLQDYIPGGPDTVWMFNGYFNRDSDCLIGLCGQKLRQFPPYTGATSLGVCVRNDRVEETSRSFMKAVGYRGIVDMGYRYDARDGQYKVLDVNPRVGATFRLFVDTAGLDVVKALYEDLTGQAVSSGGPREGRKWMVENYDLVSTLRYWRDGALGFGQWLRSLRGVEEGTWFARDDPLPFLAMCATFLPRAGLHYLRRKTPVPAAAAADRVAAGG